MKLSDITHIQDGVFELQKGHGDQTPGGEDTVQILFGGIQTALTSKELAENDDVYLPSSLAKDKLVTILVTHDGAYTDNEGKLCCLPDTVFEIIGRMKVGQKDLIQEEDAKEEGEDGHEGMKIYIVKLLGIQQSSGVNEFVELATHRKGRNEGVMPRLKRQYAAVGLEIMASPASQV